MPKQADKLTFFQSPLVEYGSNTFKNVPVILQYDNTPLIEVVQNQPAGYTSQFSIYNKDGVYIAKTKGSQLYLTKEGDKSNLVMKHPGLLTVCELDGQTLFEIQRTEAAGLKTHAELYSPDGRFIKSDEAGLPSVLLASDGSSMRIGGVTITASHFENLHIGVLVKSSGSISIGVS